jgi:kinesin family protein 2/24
MSNKILSDRGGQGGQENLIKIESGIDFVKAPENKKEKINIKRNSVTSEMEKLKKRREERKLKFEDDKKTKNNTNFENPKVDSDFENLIKKKKLSLMRQEDAHVTTEVPKIFVCVRKRPISSKELNIGEIDCVSTINPSLYVHECKMKIDGITKYVEDHEFLFDNVFGDNRSTEEVYNFSIRPTINLILTKGIVTCFAYGQTGSGKTYTMKGLQNLAIDSLFYSPQAERFDFYVSFFEIYGGRLYDLLNNRNKLSVLEDKNQKVQIFGLEELQVINSDEMRTVIEAANAMRTTHNTVTNETSSRSHAICNIIIKEKGSEDAYGKLILVDLAGSERAQETQSNDKNRRAEGAEINKSLLALKECIRALDTKKNTNSEAHVPFRASKLTLVLRDSFVP